MAKRILVVDDDAMNRKLAEVMLNKEDYEVLTADSGPAALEILAGEQVDLVLLDIRMPGMDGIETLRRIRMSPEGNHAKVLFLSACEDSEEPKGADGLCALGCIKKPFLPKDLLAAVDAAVRQGEGGKIEN